MSTLCNYSAPLAGYAPPLARDAEKKRLRQRAPRTPCASEMRAVAARGAVAPGQDELHCDKERVWWPSHTALDRQLVSVGEPFVRKGERLVVERVNGYLRSRCV